MTDKEYVCAYKHCLHHGQKVKASESVVRGKKHYHWDCATRNQEINECVDEYMNCIEDKSQAPIARRIINTLIFKNGVPVEFILKNIKSCKSYYSEKPVQILYGLRKLFWEREVRCQFKTEEIKSDF